MGFFSSVSRILFRFFIIALRKHLCYDSNQLFAHRIDKIYKKKTNFFLDSENIGT